MHHTIESSILFERSHETITRVEVIPNTTYASIYVGGDNTERERKINLNKPGLLKLIEALKEVSEEIEERTPWAIDTFRQLVLKEKTHKVRTAEHPEMRIICTDVKDDLPPVMALIMTPDGTEDVGRFAVDGDAYPKVDNLYLVPIS